MFILHASTPMLDPKPVADRSATGNSMNILHVDSSILGPQSASRALSAAVVARLRAIAPGAKVRYRDLAADPLPHLDGAALAKSDPAHAARDECVLAEFEAADTVVLGVPMYNFTIPGQLKAWIDRVAVAGRTFRYTEHGPEGLAGDKRVIAAASYGGAHPAGGASNFVEPYLRFLFGFLGIDEVEFVTAEGLAVSPQQREQALADAHARIATLETELARAA
jgi:FMN-dependent NADH-azoreductase